MTFSMQKRVKSGMKTPSLLGGALFASITLITLSGEALGLFSAVAKQIKMLRTVRLEYYQLLTFF